MAIQSKFYSTCPLCGKRIKKGDWVDTKNRLGKWAHEKCPTGIKEDSKPVAGLSGINTLFETNGVEDKSLSYSDVKEFKPSPYQLAVFDFLVNGEGHAMVEAVAGSGKTTTILKALNYVPLAILVEQKIIPAPATLDISILENYPNLPLMLAQRKIGFLAFNKHIVKELKNRAPDYVHVSTLHSLGLSALRHAFVDIKVDDDEDDKVGSIMDRTWPISKEYEAQGEKKTLDPKERKRNMLIRAGMRKLVSICKATLTDYNNRDEILSLIERQNTEIDESVFEVVVENLKKVMQACKADTRHADFDDMIWLPIVLNLQLEKFDYLFIDERQDLNKCQIEYIMRSLVDTGRRKGRIIAVGDKKQSLYGFRGADIYATENMTKVLNAKTLPLSISYRCPKSHVELAKSIVPQIEASSTAVEGEIFHIDMKTFSKTVDVGDMVVCRTNAPLIAPAFECIRQGKKAVIRGKDIGRSLVTFIKKFDAVNLADLEIKMAEFTSKEIDRLLNRGKELQAALAMDKFETIKTVANQSKDVKDLVFKLEMLFQDSNNGIVFSTIHRAKGLEAKNVFILKPELMPHPKATQEWEKEQEDNTRYVAFTRAKENLYFVKSEDL
jgi:DNA helicase II / ATP-dependent DNA helicase PcrA